MASTAMKPTLWRLRAYFSPGFPSPTKSSMTNRPCIASLLRRRSSSTRGRRGTSSRSSSSTWRRSSARSAFGARSHASFRGGSGSGSSSGSGLGGGLHFFGVARRRHDGDQRQINARNRLHAFREFDVAQMLRIVDLELGDVDLDVIRNLLRLDHDVDRMGDHVHGAAALHAGCRFGIYHANWNGDADHRALPEPHEVHVQRVVAHRIELEVARDDAVLLAVDLKV